MNQNPFRASNIHDSRLLWAPNVHQRFDENCYYFLLRLRNPTGDVVGTLGQLLARALVRSSCIYELFGHYDVLVRIWATHRRRNRFIQVLEASKNLIEDARDFQAYHIDYRWAENQSMSHEDLAPYVPRINQLCKSLATGQEVSQTELNEFVTRGLVHRLPSREESYIKIYLALTRIPSAMEDKFEAEHVRELLDKAGSVLEDVSMYSGIGFANYLIKGMVSDFRKINEITVTLLEPAIQRYQLRPTTLIIANNDAPQSDEIDSEGDASLSLFHLEFWLGRDTAALIDKLSQSERDLVASVFNEFHTLLGTPFSTILEGLLVAKLRQDPILLGQQLVIIMKIENLLGRFFLDLYKSKLRIDDEGKSVEDWFRIVREAATSCNLREGKHPAKDYTFHDFLVVTNKLIADRKLSRRDVEDVLGSDWYARLDKVKDIRNEIAHGRVFQEDYIEKDWERATRSVCDVGDVYNALILRYEPSI